LKILLTGTEGYLGSVIAPMLMEAGIEVVGLDTGYYQEGWLYHGKHDSPQTLVRDLRTVPPETLQGFDAVVHMAELSNDPAGALSPANTYDINHHASVRLACLARTAGVARFVYMSSCSVYGVAEEDFVDERSAVNPQTPYACCKTLVERDVRALAMDGFSPVFLRNATAYGASPRMRFDIVLNNLAGLAWTSREIRMTSDGSPWRPLVHALDIGQAILRALQAPSAAIHNQVFNVGSSDANLRVRDIAAIVADAFPGCGLSFGERGTDNRSYRVCFDKIHSELPGFRCAWTPAQGARQLKRIFEQIQLTRELFEFRAFTRLHQLQHLLRTGQIDEQFYWRELEEQAL
jgi:nucleoside-diphosphate-sugar epimerase